MHSCYNVFDCRLIYFPGVRDRSGQETVVENQTDVPFGITRVYYLYDIPGGASRGGHAHIHLEQVIIAVSGSFDITIDDGVHKKTVHLNRSSFGLHLRPGIWREISNFSSGAVCLAFASDSYNESDYVREYPVFRQMSKNNRQKLHK